MDKVRAVIIFGTRPEAIKLFPLISELRNAPEFSITVVNTGQHDELTAEQSAVASFSSDVYLGVMRKGSSLTDLANRLQEGLSRALMALSPNFVVVQGDTASAMFGALAAFHLGIPIAHVEAGLRTYDITSPYPEEGYRRIISSVAFWNFCPSDHAAHNLHQERVGGSIHVTGNTIVDALQLVLPHVENQSVKSPSEKLVLATIHRRENVPFYPNIFSALREIAEWENVRVVMTVHPNPNVQKATDVFLKNSAVELVSPMNYSSWISHMRQADLIISDSGGIQEEASILGVPLLVVRQNTERPEVITGKYAYLCGVETDSIINFSWRVLQGEVLCTSGSPYGDGKAARRIFEILREYWEAS